MPNWSEILNEVKRIGHTTDSVRRKYLKNLSRLTGRNSIIYYSGWLQKRTPAAPNPDFGINDLDKNGFMSVIHGLKRNKGLDLILHTPGGATLYEQMGLATQAQRITGNGLESIGPGALTEPSRGRCRFGRGFTRTHGADDRLLGLDDEEEDEAAEEEPRPDAKRHALGLEQGLQRRRVGVEKLQDHDRADPSREIWVPEMRHRRQRRFDLEPAVQEIEDLADHQRIDRDRARERVGSILRFHPEERP